MATSLIENITNLIQTIYSGSLAKTLNNTSAVFNLMNEMGRVKTKKRLKLNWPFVSTEMDNADAIADGGTLPEADREEYGQAVLDFAIIIKTVRIGRLLQRGSASPEFFKSPEFTDALGSQVNAALLKMARSIHIQLTQDAAGANEIVGLADALCKNDNTYAGIDRTTNPSWQPYVNDNGTVLRALTEDLMRDVLYTVQDNREGNPEQIWAGTTAFSAAEDLLGAKGEQVLDPENLRAGALRIWWKGIPITRIPNLNANRMLFLDFNAGDGINLVRQHDEDFLVQEESTNSYDTRWSVAGHYQLEVHEPFKQGCLDDIQ